VAGEQENYTWEGKFFLDRVSRRYGKGILDIVADICCPTDFTTSFFRNFMLY
jgi:hypothetical protein